MNTDLWMLLASTGLCFALIILGAFPTLKNPIKALGNRETPPERSPIDARVHRACENMKENLPLFIAVVAIVQLAGTANDTSALGAQLFFAGRVAHAVVYIAGIPGLRTLAWAVSILGMAMMISTVF